MKSINEYPEHCVYCANKGLKLETKIFNDIKESMKSKNYGALKASHDTALERFSDFENCLTLASTLSPNIAKQWLMIVDKVRVMNISHQKNFSDKPVPSLEVSSENYTDCNFSVIDVYRLNAMSIGFKAYCEAIVEWNNLIKKEL